ncbi:hypothetical protein GCU49_01915 [Modestobacter roseus]|nr:hypothetical protein [Modestobacter roseus]
MRKVVGGPMTVQRAAGFRNGIDVRVRLRREGTRADVPVDGAWWPRSRDLAAELPELVAALAGLGVRVERFTYPSTVWQPVERRIAVAGRIVRTGAFTSMDPQLVSLTVEDDRRLDLLVVPPEADALTGVRALRLAGLKENSGTAQRVLATAGARPGPEVVPLRAG